MRKEKITTKGRHRKSKNKRTGESTKIGKEDNEKMEGGNKHWKMDQKIPQIYQKKKYGKTQKCQGKCDRFKMRHIFKYTKVKRI